MKVSTINVKELLKMCRDLKISRASSLVSEQVVRSLFVYVQSPTDGLHQNSVQKHGDDEDDDAEMVYEEFKELLGALTVYTLPDPLEPLHKRLLIVLNELFDAARSHDARILG